MKKWLINDRMKFTMLFVAVMILGIVMTLTIGPPDEAPPFVTPNP